ncbi:ATP-binding protein [Candidatus Hydrogenedentota bacterium]
MSDERIFGDFIEWLNQTWFKVPDAEELLPLLRARYTQEEAEFLTGMPFSGRSLTELVEMKQADRSELEAKLDGLARKGLVFRRVKDGEPRYSLNDAYFVFLRSTFWPDRDDDTLKAIAPHANKYFYNGFYDQYAKAHHKGLRTVHINKTVEDPRVVLPYEDVVKIVDERQYWCVTQCACRHRKNLDPDSPDCDLPMEACLHFDALARYIVDNGMGREISRDEAHEILKESAEAGLVHGASSWRDGVDTICNCCKCCCVWMEAYHILGHTRSLDPSNYRVRTDSEKCKGCGLCVERCPMEGLRLEESESAGNRPGKVAVLTPERCIGCGVCVYKCPSDGLVLERRAETTVPPKDAREYIRLFDAECRESTEGPNKK